MLNICFLNDFDYSSISKNICGTFYIEVNGIAFPEDQWNDFPFAILRMWCEIIIGSVVNRQSDIFDLPFMDGPFFMECHKNKEEIKMLFIRGIHGIYLDKNRMIENEITINFDELIKLICQASKNLIELVEQQDFGEINDVEELKELIARLSNMFR